MFDLDGTLLDRRRSFERFARDQWHRFSPVLQAVHPDDYVQTLIRVDGNGYAPRRELFTGLLTTLGLPRDLADTLLSDYRARFPSICMLSPDVLRTLAALRASGRTLGLITNGSVRMQSGKLQCLFPASTFDAVLISEAEGVHKPDPEIFRRALTRLHTDPSRSVFVGDHPDVDIGGARAAGMQTVWRRDPTVSRPVDADATIEEVGESSRFSASDSAIGNNHSRALRSSRRRGLDELGVERWVLGVESDIIRLKQSDMSVATPGFPAQPGPSSISLEIRR